MNPLLDRLQPYPFERLRALLAGVAAAGALADPAVDRRTATRDARPRPNGARRSPGWSRRLSGNRRTRPAPRDAGGVVQAAVRAAATRCGHRGAAGQRYPRSAVRVCAGGHRRFATRPDRGLPEPVLPDLRRRRAPRRRRAGVPQSDGRQRIRPGSGFAHGRGVAPHAAALRVLTGKSDRPGARSGRLACAVRACRSVRVRDRVRRVLLGDLPGRRGAAARAPWTRPTGWAVTTSATSWCSPACPSARTPRVCGPAAWPAMRRCSSGFASIAHIMGAR